MPIAQLREYLTTFSYISRGTDITLSAIRAEINNQEINFLSPIENILYKQLLIIELFWDSCHETPNAGSYQVGLKNAIRESIEKSSLAEVTSLLNQAEGTVNSRILAIAFTILREYTKEIEDQKKSPAPASTPSGPLISDRGTSFGDAKGRISDTITRATPAPPPAAPSPPPRPAAAPASSVSVVPTAAAGAVPIAVAAAGAASAATASHAAETSTDAASDTKAGDTSAAALDDIAIEIDEETHTAARPASAAAAAADDTKITSLPAAVSATAVPTASAAAAAVDTNPKQDVKQPAAAPPEAPGKSIAELIKRAENLYRQNEKLLQKAKSNPEAIKQLPKIITSLRKALETMRENHSDIPAEREKLEALKTKFSNLITAMERQSHSSEAEHFALYASDYVEYRRNDTDLENVKTQYETDIKNWKTQQGLAEAKTSAVSGLDPMLSAITEQEEKTGAKRRADEIFRGYPAKHNENESIAFEREYHSHYEQQIIDLPYAISDRGLLEKFLAGYGAESTQDGKSVKQLMKELPPALNKEIVQHFMQSKIEIPATKTLRSYASLAEKFLEYRHEQRSVEVYVETKNFLGNRSNKKVTIPNQAIFNEAAKMLNRILDKGKLPVAFTEPHCKELYDAAFILVKLNNLEKQFVFPLSILEPSKEMIEAAKGHWTHEEQYKNNNAKTNHTHLLEQTKVEHISQHIMEETSQIAEEFKRPSP